VVMVRHITTSTVEGDFCVFLWFESRVQERRKDSGYILAQEPGGGGVEWGQIRQ